MHQRARQGDPLFHPTGQLARIIRSESLHPDERKELMQQLSC